MSTDPVCKNNPGRVTYISAGHQEGDICDINNHNPHLTQEHSQAVQQPKKGADKGQITAQASIFWRKLSKDNRNYIEQMKCFANIDMNVQMLPGTGSVSW